MIWKIALYSGLAYVGYRLASPSGCACKAAQTDPAGAGVFSELERHAGSVQQTLSGAIDEVGGFVSDLLDPLTSSSGGTGTNKESCACS